MADIRGFEMDQSQRFDDIPWLSGKSEHRDRLARPEKFQSEREFERESERSDWQQNPSSQTYVREERQEERQEEEPLRHDSMENMSNEEVPRFPITDPIIDDLVFDGAEISTLHYDDRGDSVSETRQAGNGPEDLQQRRVSFQGESSSRKQEEFRSRDRSQISNGRPLSTLFRDLIMWRNVRESGIIFSVGLVLLLALSYFSLVTLFAYASLAIILLSGAFVFGRQLTLVFQQRSNEPHPFHRMLERDVVISPDYVHNQVDIVLRPINNTLVRMRNLYLADSLAETLKMTLYMYLLTYVGAWFNLLTLVIIGWVGIFSVPRLYTMYGRRIDDALEMVEHLRINLMDRIRSGFEVQREKIMKKRSGKKRLSSPPPPQQEKKVVKVEREVKIEKKVK